MAWVFGLSLFSLKGEHIGWCEEGVFFDVQNNVLGFLAGAKGMPMEFPALGPEPAVPAFSKRPYVPTLRGRTSRPAGQGWSSFCLANYLHFSHVPSSTAPFLPRPQALGRAAGSEHPC